jgi:histidinol dehydrogenase
MRQASGKNPAGSIGSVQNHRERESGVIVYPVYSRRSGGLSLGINLFTGGKTCEFDCPYCEVFSFKADAEFQLAAMEAQIVRVVETVGEDGRDIRDICFSGNGEPTISAHFSPALDLAIALRARYAPEAKIVVISSGTGLLREKVFQKLTEVATTVSAFELWLKVDAGTEAWFRAINRSKTGYSSLISAIQRFAAAAPCVIQTMHCSVHGERPPPVELEAWAALVSGLSRGGMVKAVQIYGKARPSEHDPICAPLPASELEHRAALLHAAFSRQAISTPVSVYE